MINKKDLPRIIVKQLAYENRTFLRAYIPTEPNGFTGANYEVSHNGRVFCYSDLDMAINKFNEEAVMNNANDKRRNH